LDPTPRLESLGYVDLRKHSVEELSQPICHVVERGALLRLSKEAGVRLNAPSRPV